MTLKNQDYDNPFFDIAIVDIDDIEIPVLPKEFYDHYKMRTAKVLLFYKFLCRHKKFANIPNQIKHKIIDLLEKSCYALTREKAEEMNIQCNWDINEFDDIYHLKCGTVISYFTFNIRNIKSLIKADTIILSLISNCENPNLKYANAQNLPFKKHKDIYFEDYDIVNERYNANKQIHIKTSKLRTCPKCKQQVTTVRNVYNRSLDEGTNLEATCLFCNKTWFC